MLESKFLFLGKIFIFSFFIINIFFPVKFFHKLLFRYYNYLIGHCYFISFIFINIKIYLYKKFKIIKSILILIKKMKMNLIKKIEL